MLWRRSRFLNWEAVKGATQHSNSLKETFNVSSARHFKTTSPQTCPENWKNWVSDWNFMETLVMKGHYRSHDIFGFWQIEMLSYPLKLDPYIVLEPNEKLPLISTLQNNVIISELVIEISTHFDKIFMNNFANVQFFDQLSCLIIGMLPLSIFLALLVPLTFQSTVECSIAWGRVLRAAECLQPH